MLVRNTDSEAPSPYFTAATPVTSPGITHLVLGSSIILLLFAFRAARGSRSYWLRVRIISPIVVTAVVVVVSIPGFLPDWVRVEQGVCGVLVLAAAILVNLPRARAHFPGTHFPGTHFPGTE